MLITIPVNTSHYLYLTRSHPSIPHIHPSLPFCHPLTLPSVHFPISFNNFAIAGFSSLLLPLPLICIEKSLLCLKLISRLFSLSKKIYKSSKSNNFFFKWYIICMFIFLHTHRKINKSPCYLQFHFSDSTIQVSALVYNAHVAASFRILVPI